MIDDIKSSFSSKTAKSVDFERSIVEKNNQKYTFIASSYLWSATQILLHWTIAVIKFMNKILSVECEFGLICFRVSARVFIKSFDSFKLSKHDFFPSNFPCGDNQ